jgi:hypothetical protein
VFRGVTGRVRQFCLRRRMANETVSHSPWAYREEADNRNRVLTQECAGGNNATPLSMDSDGSVLTSRQVPSSDGKEKNTHLDRKGGTP